MELPAECMPASGLVAGFTLEPAEATRLHMTCTVLSVASEAVGERIIELDCGFEGPFTLSVSASEEYYIMLPEGDEVFLVYERESPWWINRWFQMTRGSDFILAGIDADRLYPPNEDPDLMYAPLTLETVRGDCPPSEQSCYTNRRVGIRAVHYEGPETTVFGGNRGSGGRPGPEYTAAVEPGQLCNGPLHHCPFIPCDSDGSHRDLSAPRPQESFDLDDSTGSCSNF